MSSGIHVSKTRAVVQDNPALERDLSSQAIINRNRTEYVRRLAVKEATAKKNAEFESLRDEVQELKELVKSLLSSQNNSTT